MVEYGFGNGQQQYADAGCGKYYCDTNGNSYEFPSISYFYNYVNYSDNIYENGIQNF